MIVDSSALIAVLEGEPEAQGILRLLGSVEAAISAATFVEARIVALNRRGPIGLRRLDAMVSEADLRVEPVDAAQADAATAAYRDFGRGSGHPARLNYGDTFAYALAHLRGEPLLYVGDEFSRTDIRSALEEYGEQE